MTDKIKDLMDEAEDALFQKIIDRQEGAQGIAENTLPAPGPTGAELARWTLALDALSRQAPPQRKRVRLRRTVILAALLGAALLVAAGAFHRQILNWIETAHDQYAQLQAGRTAQQELDGWTGAYVPTALPLGYVLRYAKSTEQFKVIEYADSSGDQITFYQYCASSTVRFDTEEASKTVFPWVGETTAYQFQKGGRTTLYWTNKTSVFSIAFDAASVPESEMLSFAQSFEWRQ